MAYENILTEVRGRVGLITLNRPRQLNALNDALMNELGTALGAFDTDDNIGAIVIAGSERACAAAPAALAKKDWWKRSLSRPDLTRGIGKLLRWFPTPGTAPGRGF